MLQLNVMNQLKEVFKKMKRTLLILSLLFIIGCTNTECKECIYPDVTCPECNCPQEIKK